MLLSNDASHSVALICRKDLSLSKGKFASQCAHAAVNAPLYSQKNAKSDYEIGEIQRSRKGKYFMEKISNN